MFNKARVTTGLALIFSFSVFSSVAYAIAQTWVDDGHVYICINRANGDMHAIQESQSCKATEELVVVPTGSSGVNGATGATGATGPQGDTGARGPVGSTGAQGVAGTQGATGVAGPVGATGAMGPNGATGANGAPGADGATGATGADGAQGATGATGAAGASGASGLPGTTGQNGATVMSSGALTLSTSNPGPTQVPGLSVDVAVGSPNAVLFVETDGVLAISGLPGDEATVDVRVFVGTSMVASRTFDVEQGRASFRSAWSVAVSVPVTAGSYTVSVQASLRSSSFLSGLTPTVFVGGTASNPNHGELTVLTLNK